MNNGDKRYGIITWGNGHGVMTGGNRYGGITVHLLCCLCPRMPPESRVRVRVRAADPPIHSQKPTSHLVLTFTLSATPSTTNVAEDLQSETVCRVHPHKTAGRNKLESWLASVICVAQLHEKKTLRTTLWFAAVARVDGAGKSCNRE